MSEKKTCTITLSGYDALYLSIAFDYAAQYMPDFEPGEPQMDFHINKKLIAKLKAKIGDELRAQDCYEARLF